jgi:long-chain acyl-CoA synthetase
MLCDGDLCVWGSRCVKYTLFRVTCGDVLKLKEDCQVIKPTIFISVPRLYNRIVEGVKGKFLNETGIKKWLIDKGVNSKLEALHETGEYTSSFYDSVVFSKVREGFGGNVRVMASGSAPLSPESHEFMMAIMCCPLIEGYGST